jgi:hypothetical protein
MKTIYVTRTEPVTIEDEQTCSEKCLHYGPHNGRCCLFEVTIPLDEETGEPQRVHECRTGEKERNKSREIESAAEAACELAEMLKEAASLGKDLEYTLDNIS